MESRRGADVRRIGNVPAALSSFVGREAVLADLGQRLTEARLVTLTGVGGGGKTRLALELAERVAGDYEDGVWLAELASVTDPHVLVQTVLSAVDVPHQSTREPLRTLVDYLRDKRMLLVLDNCEQLSNAAAKLAATLLRDARDLRIVATSRSLLGVTGEVVVGVPTMTVPASLDAPMPEDPQREYEAVALLMERARASVEGWEITPQNWPYVVRMLQRLDGIPLAIELATVRLRSMCIETLVERMDDMMRLLNSNDLTVLAHHETLHTVIKWSHDLCADVERLLWARISTFSGTFTLGAVEAVCADDQLPAGDVADALDRLVAHSIVETTSTRWRYRLLEPMQQYGALLLADRGEQETLLLRHRDYYRQVAARAAASWYSPGEFDLLREIGRDMPNFRAVMSAYIAAPDQEQSGLQLVVDLARTRWHFFAGQMPEGIGWLDRVLTATPNADPLLEAGALALDVFIDMCTGTDHDQARARLDRARALADEIGEPLPPVLLAHGVYLLWAHSDLAGLSLLDQAYHGFRELGVDCYGDAAMAILFKTIATALLCEDEQDVRAAVTRMLDEARGRSPWTYSWALWCGTIAELRFGSPAVAVEGLRENTREAIAAGDQWLPMWTVEVKAWAKARLAATHRRAADARDTAVLLGATSTLNQIKGVLMDALGPFAAFRREAEDTARRVLGQADYDAAFAAGAQVQTYEEAVQLALQEDDSPLTPRQWDVAVLLPLGWTNVQIARHLVISERTVESHIRDIYRRLGTPSRIKVARWVESQNAVRT